MRVELHDGWTVRAVGGDVPVELAGGTVPATVPGVVHLDLLAAGLMPDPYLDENEAAVAWVGRVDWRWETTFGWEGPGAGEEADLVALGLDTVAEVELNGTVVTRTANMHRSSRARVTAVLTPGENHLAVTVRAGLTAAEEAAEELGPRPHVNPHPYNALRKAACSYGWDWGPELVTAGIWRPLHLETWRTARIAGVRPLVAVDGTTGVLTAQVDVERDSSRAPLTVALRVGEAHASARLGEGGTSTAIEVRVPGAELWWPRGYGAQPLYPVSVELSAGGEPLDHWNGRVGFRTVTLDTAPDEHGTPFTLVVNGTPVFARGANWIPDDALLPRVTRERYRERVGQAVAANVNLLRVWGGGLYESDDLYDACDELGVLVWQDFLFACAAYAEEEPLRAEVVAEAREAVTRLSPHPALVLWNGGNENLWGHEDWGWKEQLGDLSWGLGYYEELLPAVLAELDPTRPYCPGSPWSPDPARHPNDPSCGTTHLWEVWNRLDQRHYRDAVPRFVSEFGFQGPPTWATLTRAVHDRPRRPDGPALLTHQKAEDGQAKLARGLAGHLPEPAGFEEWHWATSLNQARAVALGIEHARSWSPVCSGAVVWQLNDCWPVVSWSAVDGDGRRKPLWYAMRHSFAERLLTLQPRDGRPALVAVNDTGEPWVGRVEVTRRGFDGTVLARAQVALDVPPRGTATAGLPDAVTSAGDPAREVLLAEPPPGTGAARAWWPFAEDVDAALEPADLLVVAERETGGYRLTLTARTFVRDLAVLADKVAPDAVADDMLLTLLPGETAAVTVLTAADVDPAAFAAPHVLRSANQLVAP